MIVVDTNVISELMKPAPSAKVVEWETSRDAASFYTTAITVAEVMFGVQRLPTGRRRDLLRSSAEDVFASFGRNVLSFDSAAAQAYAELVSARERAGTPMDAFDAQIAAICRVHGAALATRNVKDFQDTGVELVDPWCHNS